VDVGELQTLVQWLQSAVSAARQVQEHPGVVRGRAQDGGWPPLRDAAAELADRWEWSLGSLADDADRVAALLQLAVDRYVEAERQAVAQVDHARWLWGGR
jgi:hypothetical protein